MSRPLRIEYPDVWYHVMNRARKGQDAFPSDEDCNSFIDITEDTAKITLVQNRNLDDSPPQIVFNDLSANKNQNPIKKEG